MSASSGMSSIDTYKGQKITAQTLVALAPKPAPEVARAFNQWMIKHKKVVAALTHLVVWGDAEKREKRYRMLLLLIKKANLESMSRHSFIFPIEVTVNGVRKKYCVKIPGIGVLLANYNAAVKTCKMPFADLSFFEYLALKVKRKLTTYQGVSRVPTMLRLQEWIAAHPESRFVAPASYLVHIPGRPRELSDKNYVVIEEWIDGIGTARDHPKLVLEAVPELREASTYSGLWDIFPEQFVITKEYKIACIDTEQTPNMPFTYFFHKNRRKYEGTLEVGQKQIDKMVQILEKLLC